MRYVRGTVAPSVKLRVTTRIRSYWRGNSDVALDGAGRYDSFQEWHSALLVIGCGLVATGEFEFAERKKPAGATKAKRKI